MIMRRFTTFALAAAILLTFNVSDAKAVDMYNIAGSLIGHCYNWLRDDDGDGIPNCLDEDYVPPEDGTGYGNCGGDSVALASGMGLERDDDGDGIPNGDDPDYVPPLDGTGYGQLGSK
jgi:hypothetical protein